MNWTRILRRTSLALALATAVGGAAVASAGTWTAVAANLPVPIAGVAILLSDGTVLVLCDGVGGDSIGDTWRRLTPDSHGSYVNGTWSTIAAMPNSRLYFSSQLLKDGRLYVAGGEYGTGKSKGEVYDPVANTWTATGDTGGVVSDANSEILPDGRVLQALVTGDLKKIRIYDPATNAFINGPSTLGIHNESVWVKLADDSVLFVDRGDVTSERYIPATNTWVSAGTVPVSLYDPWGLETGGAVLLPDGRAFFLGSLSTSAFYTPSTGQWTAGPALPNGSGVPDGPMAMMVDGKVLCAMSPAPTPADHFPTPTKFYVFDPATNAFTQTGAPGGGTSIADSVYVFCFLTLPDGSVMSVQQGMNTCYVYTPDGAPIAAGKPAIASVTKTAASTYLLAGTGFNGISQGASYGDDWQMNTNYPLARLTSANGTVVRYARTFNWNRTGVATGAAPTTTMIALPSGLAPGSYSLSVVANGIPSSSVPFVVTASACLPDLNADGLVNGADLAVLLGAWGTSGPGDFNGSGTVDGADLATMLGARGACP